MQKILSDSVTPMFQINIAFSEAVDSLGANIISNSWAYNSCNVYYDYTLYNIISDAVQNAGVFVIWGSGNCGNPTSPPCSQCVLFPSNHPNVFCVGASNKTDNRWDSSYYSSSEYKIDACAPGVDIIILDQMGSAGLSGKTDCVGGNDNYECGHSGTSYAAPQVAALAAMIMGRRPDLIGQPYQIEQIIKYSTGNGWHYPAVEDPHVQTYEMGYGRINAARALLAISRGDVNNDVVVDILDINYLINYKYYAGPAPVPNMRLGDVNCDGTVDILDCIYLVNYKFKGGPAPLTCYKF